MKKALLWILLILLAAYLFWRWWNSSLQTADRGEKLFYDRVWLDKLPRAETDTVAAFIAVREEPIGLFQSASAWKGDYELFRYEPQGDGRVVLLYPQTRDKERVGYRAVACSERGFDFCLELQGASRGVRRYYSQKGWEIGASEDARHAVERVESQRY
jgi:hypothetical protein